MMNDNKTKNKDATKKSAIFLDRDGTININKEYLFKKEDWEFTESAIDALKMLQNLDFLLIVTSNQSGIGRGFYTESDVFKLHSYVDSLLSKFDIKIDGWYFCPHAPNEVLPCNCRKPSPFMIENAAKIHNIEIRSSWMIGDSIVDIEAGKNAGCRTILVTTGHGEKFLNSISKDVYVAKNLLDAAKYISHTQ